MSRLSAVTPRTLRMRARSTPVAPRAARLAQELADRWAGGERPRVEELLATFADAPVDSETLLALICEEICLREEHGEPVAPEAIVERFPALGEPLRVLLQCHSLFARPLDPGPFPGVGETVSGFRLETELGRGGESRVFVARQESLSDRQVVVKIVPPATSEHFRLARLQHTHIVPLYSAETTAGGRWLVLVMPYFGSKTLNGLLDSLRALPVADRTGQRLLDALDDEPAGLPAVARGGAVRRFLGRVNFTQAICWFGACLADALHAAHEHDLVHLDVKPSNVLITAEGQPMLLDFHLARPPLRPGGSTPAWLGGTPAYLSPEQAAALAELSSGYAITTTVDARSDIYSLGVLLCEALGSEVRAGRACAIPTGRHVSRGLADILARCLAPRPQDRYATAADLADDLRRHLNDLPLRGVANRSLVERWRKWRRRRAGAPARLAALAVGVGMALAGTWLWSERREPASVGTAVTVDQTAVVQRIHDLAEQLRRFDAAGQDDPEQHERLARACRALWDERATLIRRVVRTAPLDNDLLDIVLLWPGFDRALLPEAEQIVGDRIGLVHDEYRLGRSLIRAGHYDEAEPHLLRAVEANPASFWAQYQLGECAYHLRKDEEAILAFTAAAALAGDSDRASCYRGRALVYRRLGREAEAVADESRAKARRAHGS